MTVKRKARISREQYALGPAFCRACGAELPFEKRLNKMCNNSCAARVNNIGRRRHGKPPRFCPICTKLVKPNCQRCSSACDKTFKYQKYIEEWKAGKRSGIGADGKVCLPVKRYLREKFGNKCTECGWSKVNVYTGVVPLNADHIDGNWQNNTEGNLRLLCGCCDSLTSTYGGQNKGRGNGRYKGKWGKPLDVTGVHSSIG